MEKSYLFKCMECDETLNSKYIKVFETHTKITKHHAFKKEKNV